jgi:hypothetical protein
MSFEGLVSYVDEYSGVLSTAEKEATLLAGTYFLKYASPALRSLPGLTAEIAPTTSKGNQLS